MTIKAPSGEEPQSIKPQDWGRVPAWRQCPPPAGSAGRGPATASS